MPRSFLLTTLLSLSITTGCQGAGPVTPDQKPSQNADSLITQRVEEVKAGILADTCFQQQPDVSVCNWGDFPYDPSQFAMTHDTGEAILIMDDFPALPPRAIRYKNRLKGFFRTGQDGTISPVSFAWHAPTALYEGLSKFASPDFIPAEWLRPLSEPMRTVYRSYAETNAGHGSSVLSVLVEANPHQPIVVLDQLSYPLFALEEFCDASGTDESIDRLRAKSQRVADELRRLMSELNVRYVNVSSGESLATMRSRWTTHCGGALPGDALLRAKLYAYGPVYDALYNTPGVFAANASINGANSQDNPFDFPSAAYPNRLLVGFFTTLDSGLDEQGRGNPSSLSGWPGVQNVDLYLNSGVLSSRPFPYNSTPLLQVDAFGVDIFPITRTTTSWITPLALSRFIHARYSSFAERAMSNELIAEIRDMLVPSGCNSLPGGRCIYQDPLKHGQLEAMRLGYRPCEYVEPTTLR